MTDQEKMDQWLREQLKDYRPALSDASKDRFLSGVYGKTTTNNKTKFAILLITALLLPLAAILLFKTNNTEIRTMPVKNVPSTNTSEPKNTPTVKSTSIVKNISIVKKTLEPYSNYESTKPEIKPNVISDYYPKSDDLVIKAENTEIKPLNNEADQSMNIDSVITEPYPADTLTVEKLPDPEQKIKRDQYLWNTALSIHYRPELLYNVIGNEKLLQNFGIEYNKRLFNGNYIVGTGLGISLTRGYYEYAIEYNEFLGNFQRLDSITFDWQPASFTMQQTLHTSEERVFDSKISKDYAKVERKFIYLQVPLILGYDFYNNHRWSAGVRVNPVLSLLLSRKPVDFRYETGENRLIQINRITPDRVRANWQLAAGVTVSRRLSENLWIELQPGFAYYFNSVYEKPVITESPWSVSLKIALGLRY